MQEEKRLKFTELYISNFRNITEKTIKFNDGVTKIEGENGLGKTNILSSIMWCIFGKDIYDKKQFPISPIINGKEDNSLNTIVRLTINDNYVIERSYKNRKANLKTGWIIDGKAELVAITQTKYNEELKENFIDEETFKSLSNINYIPNLNWKDLKELIFSLIGNIEDDEVLLRDDFNLIEEYVRKFGIDETQRLLKNTDSELNDDIKRLETEYQTLLNTKDKYVCSDEDNKELIARKEEIVNQLNTISETQKAQQEHNEKKISLKNELNKVDLEISRINISIKDYEDRIADYTGLYRNSGMSEEQLREKDLTNLNVKLEQTNKSIEKLESDLKTNKDDLEFLKQRGEELKAKEVKVENDTCSACGQHLPEEKIQETLNKLKEQQQNDLLKLKSKYDDKKQLIETLINEIAKATTLRDETIADIEFTKTKKYEVEQETEKQKEIRVRKEQKEIELKQAKETLPNFLNEHDRLEKELQELYSKEFKSIDTTSLNAELNDINNKLATTITLNKLNEDVENKAKELEDKRNNKVVNKNKLQEVVKFNNIKADLLQKKVRSYFSLISFKTKEFNQNGEEQETFKIITNDGVEWKETNTANRILMSLDLISGIQKIKSTFVPIIIDGVEVMTSELNVDNTQLIVTRAIKDKKELEVK